MPSRVFTTVVGVIVVVKMLPNSYVCQPPGVQLTCMYSLRLLP